MIYIFNTLRYFKDVLYCIEDNKRKNVIKKIYNKDRKELIDTTDLYIVKLRQVVDLNKDSLGDSVNLYKWKSKYLYKTILRKNCPGSYSDLITDKVYLEPNSIIFDNGIIYVDEKQEGDVIPLAQKLENYGKVEKVKVLNLTYKLNKKIF